MTKMNQCTDEIGRPAEGKQLVSRFGRPISNSGKRQRDSATIEIMSWLYPDEIQIRFLKNMAGKGGSYLQTCSGSLEFV